MYDINPFAQLATLIPSGVIQAYIVLMLLAVVGGTIFDVLHKKSAKYFFQAAEAAKKNATREIDSSERLSLTMKTVADEILTSSEFCNPKRRIAHLLTMYGFVLYVAATAIMVFFYLSDISTPILTILWTLGALMICIGGYWFWFFIRVDVAAEGHSPFRLVTADLFVVSLVLSATFGLIWAYLQASVGYGAWTYAALALYIISSTVLFGSVPWSKFAHMFFKPAAAVQKRVEKADGSLNNMPKPADRNDPADRDRHSMELLVDAPMDMGLGIKREEPKHY